MKKGEFNVAYLLLFLIIVFVIAIFITTKGNFNYSDKESSKLIITGELPPLAEIEKKEKECSALPDQEIKDDCFWELAELVDEKQGEINSAKVCEMILDDEKHDDCIDDMAFELVSTCEMLRTKDTNPEKWYNDCIDFVADDVQTCRLIKNDKALTNECIDFVAETPEDCLEIQDDDKLVSTCIEFIAENKEDCDKIPLDNIKTRCIAAF